MTEPGKRVGRVYVDMVGDLFHAGHVELLRAAKDRGEQVVVGVLSDEAVAVYKRTPVMTLTERVAVIEACRYVDEVIADAPYRVDTEFLDRHRIDLVLHGDDLDADGARAVYGDVLDAGKLGYVRRTSAISTTALIGRILDAQDPHRSR